MGREYHHERSWVLVSIWMLPQENYLPALWQNSKVESIFWFDELTNYPRTQLLFCLPDINPVALYLVVLQVKLWIKTIFRRAFRFEFANYLAMGKFEGSGVEPTTFYEKRLVYFGSGRGDSQVERRLKVSVVFPSKPATPHPQSTCWLLILRCRRRSSLPIWGATPIRWGRVRGVCVYTAS